MKLPRIRVCQAGATLVEAAAALPLFIMIVFGTISVGNLIEARSELYEQVTSAARTFTAAKFPCSTTDAEVAAYTSQFQDRLSKKGYSGSLVATALDNTENVAWDPSVIAKWRLDASLSPTCPLCTPFQLVGIFPTSLSATLLVTAENEGCSQI